MKVTLSSILNGLPIARLKEIITVRGLSNLSADTKRELIGQMSRQLSESRPTVSCISELTLLEQMLLLFVVCHDGSVLRSELDEDINNRLDRGRVEDVLHSLESSALLFALRAPNGQVILHAPACVCQCISLPMTMRFRLDELLEEHRAEEVQEIATALGLVGRGTKKSDRIKQIVGYLSDPSQMHRIYDGLSKAQQEIFHSLLHGENRLRYSDLRKRHDVERSYYDEFYLSRHGSRNNGGELHELVRRGLVFQGERWSLDPLIVVPKEILDAINGPAQWKWEVPGAELEAVPATNLRFVSNESLAQDIVAFLSFVRANRPKEVQRGGFGKPDLKRAGKWICADSQDPYVGYLAALTLKMGLVTTSDKRPAFQDDECDDFSYESSYGILVLGRSVHKYLGQPRDILKLAVTQAWLEMRGWNDLAEDQLMDDSGYSFIESRRRKLCNLLLEISPECAIEPIALWRTLQFRWPSVFNLTPDSDLDAGIAERQVEYTLCKLMSRLGLTEVATQGAKTLVRLRPDARSIVESALRGDALALKESKASPAYETQFVVQANMEIIAGQHIHPLILLTLSEFTRFKSNQQAIILKMSADSLRSGLDLGMTPQQVLKLLEEHSSSGVPQAVRFAVEDVGGRHGNIRVGKCSSYIVAKDEHLLQLIKADKKMSAYIDAFLAPTVATVRDDCYDSLLKDLRKAGHMPLDNSTLTSARSNAWVKAVKDPPALPSVKRAASLPARKFAIQQSRVDWDRIAAEESLRPTLDLTHGTGEPAVMKTQKEIRDLIGEAAKNGGTIEIFYKGGSGETIRKIAPKAYNIRMVSGFCSLTESDQLFVIDKIKWARRA